MLILAIDPGPVTSGAVLLEPVLELERSNQPWIWTPSGKPPTVRGIWRAANIDEIRDIFVHCPSHVIVEGLTTYRPAKGKSRPVGAPVFETAYNLGAIREMSKIRGISFHVLTRPEVALELCQARNATEAQLSEAVRDIYRPYAPVGGGADPVRGRKDCPGPLYGIALGDHEGSALKVGVAWWRQWAEGRL